MIPIILCGGEGQRLWPVSNKLFHNFFKESLFEMTLKRLQRCRPFVIVTQEKFAPYIEKGLKRQNIKGDIIFEPVGKNTAPAVALACHFLRRRGRQKDVVGIFPSDHIIQDESLFRNILSAAAQTARNKGKVVTLGLKLSPFAGSGYGYIKLEGSSEDTEGFPVSRVSRFVEKPDPLRAKRLLEEGCLCNSGIFLCRLDVLTDCFETHLPDLWKKTAPAGQKLSDLYHRLNPLSFDKGIMEKTRRRLCLVCPDMGWRDQGSWDHISAADKKFPGALKNRADVVRETGEGNFVFSSRGQKVKLMGVKDLLIIEGEKGLLVMKKGLSEQVKETAEQAENSFSESLGAEETTDRAETSLFENSKVEKTADRVESLSSESVAVKEAAAREEIPSFESSGVKDPAARAETSLSESSKVRERPWGGWRIIEEGERFKCKILHVRPGGRLSYQSHQKRTERWIVVSGTARVTLEGKRINLCAGEHIFIPRGQKHRLANEGKTPLTVLEVQMGDYLGEDDIIRWQKGG